MWSKSLILIKVVEQLLFPAWVIGLLVNKGVVSSRRESLELAEADYDGYVVIPANKIYVVVYLCVSTEGFIFQFIALYAAAIA